MYPYDIEYREEEWLLLSGIQHFAFCPRQWALIHVEGQWAENLLTVEGELMHTRAHDSDKSEKRGDTLILRDLRIFSRRLGITGACDVVEFHEDTQGISLHGREGLWKPFPVEYKRGKPKLHNADELQLCAQAVCLEEMLCCNIDRGALFYGETKRRTEVEFDTNLRNKLLEMATQMHDCYRRGHTPKVKPRKECKACSLMDICIPGLDKSPSVHNWIQNKIQEVRDQ